MKTPVFYRGCVAPTRGNPSFERATALRVHGLSAWFVDSGPFGSVRGILLYSSRLPGRLRGSLPLPWSKTFVARVGLLRVKVFGAEGRRDVKKHSAELNR